MLGSEVSRNKRQQALQAWARAITGSAGLEIAPISDDASFRRYFAADVSGERRIFVDAPPDKENSDQFVMIARLLEASGLAVPHVYDCDLEAGFMMLSDLGENLYFDALKSDNDSYVELYQAAILTLGKLAHVPTDQLPTYDEAKLREEMSLFPDWFLAQQIDIDVSSEISGMLAPIIALCVENALEQPQIFVHRDFHCRNLMLRDRPGLIDFQDAVCGPITYDLVSLLKDCYWRFPREQVVSWVEDARLLLAPDVEAGVFLKWFDLMGLQRHLKCAGIFSRLNLRDSKPGYLGDIPLVLDYMLEVGGLYPELETFRDWLASEIIPASANITSARSDS